MREEQQANVHEQKQHTQRHSTMENQSEKDDRIQWYPRTHLLSHLKTLQDSQKIQTQISQASPDHQESRSRQPHAMQWNRFNL